eukprot:jgi/Botrbrau1/254/Bobra.0022s0227.2
MASLAASSLPRHFCFQSKGDGVSLQRHDVRSPRTACRVFASSEPQNTRRETLLAGVNVSVLAALFNFGAAPRPSDIGLKAYGGGIKTLALCPPTPNCISTAEEANDLSHYVPPWTYNPEEGEGKESANHKGSGHG